jgi:XTP/dITP diphosphohydrolase
MSIQVVLATRNAHKIAEVKRIVEAVCNDIEILDLAAWPDAPEVVEDATTFGGNALLKARAIAQHTQLPTIADDSGICVDALNGMPGILSARWAGKHGKDSENLQLLLDQLSEVPAARRSGNFTCAVALVTPDGEERVVEGVVDGKITTAPRGADGFGYDPIFEPLGLDRTTAELSAREKDAISHRGQAIRAIVVEILNLLQPVGGCGGNCACKSSS